MGGALLPPAVHKADVRILRDMDGSLPSTQAGQPVGIGKLPDGWDGQSLKKLKLLWEH